MLWKVNPVLTSEAILQRATLSTQHFPMYPLYALRIRLMQPEIFFTQPALPSVVFFRAYQLQTPLYKYVLYAADQEMQNLPEVKITALVRC